MFFIVYFSIKIICLIFCLLKCSKDQRGKYIFLLFSSDLWYLLFYFDNWFGFVMPLIYIILYIVFIAIWKKYLRLISVINLVQVFVIFIPSAVAVIEQTGFFSPISPKFEIYFLNLKIYG